MKATFIVFIFLMLSSKVDCQFFNGKLNYIYLKCNGSSVRKLIAKFDFHSKEDCVCGKDSIAITIKDSSLETREYMGHELVSVAAQMENEVFILLNGFEIKFNQVYPVGLKYKSAKRIDKYKEILGEVCVLYLYEWEGMFIYAWVSENNKFPDSITQEKLFNRYFLDEGMAFAYAIFYDGDSSTNNDDTISYFELVSIDKFLK